MATKRTTKAGSEQSGPDTFRDVGAQIDELIARGNEGDKYALSDLYGQASAWARGGTGPIPEPLGTWIADRLNDVANVIHARKEKDAARDMAPALAIALKVTRKGVSGRAPNPRTVAREISHAQDVLHFMEWEGLPEQKAITRAFEYNSTMSPNHSVSRKTYEAAWNSHGQKLLAKAGLIYRGPTKK